MWHKTLAELQEKPRHVQSRARADQPENTKTQSQERRLNKQTWQRDKSKRNLKDQKKRPNKLINKTKAREWRHEMTKTHNHNQTTNRRL